MGCSKYRGSTDSDGNLGSVTDSGASLRAQVRLVGVMAAGGGACGSCRGRRSWAQRGGGAGLSSRGSWGCGVRQRREGGGAAPATRLQRVLTRSRGGGGVLRRLDLSAEELVVSVVLSGGGGLQACGWCSGGWPEGMETGGGSWRPLVEVQAEEEQGWRHERRRGRSYGGGAGSEVRRGWRRVAWLSRGDENERGRDVQEIGG